MATKSTKDEEVYKREYQRIKSLVSSAYVRQTSVSYMKNCHDVRVIFISRFMLPLLLGESESVYMCFNYYPSCISHIWFTLSLPLSLSRIHFRSLLSTSERSFWNSNSFSFFMDVNGRYKEEFNQRVANKKNLHLL